jgi:cytoskeleton protein RodZ
MCTPRGVAVTALNDIGRQLRGARERRDLSLQQLSSQTKIPLSALQALEQNDLSRLPGGIFTRGFVRAYASAVGLDPDQTVRDYVSAFDAERDPAAPAASPFHPEAREDTQFPGTAAALVALVALSLFAFWISRDDGALPSTPAAATVAAAQLPGADPPTQPVGTTGGTASSTSVGKSFELHLQATAPCWVSLTLDGRRVVSRVLQPGERERYRVFESAVLRVGDTGAFTYTIDGRAGRPLGPRGGVRTVRISRDTLAQLIR